MLSGLSLPILAALLVSGVVLDWLLGEVRRYHPLVGFGRLVSAIECRLNRGAMRHARGILGWILAVLPLTGLAGAVLFAGAGTMAAALVHALLLYFCIGLRSLYDHAVPIQKALAEGDLGAARRYTGRIVSRDTAGADAGDLAKAGVESLLENGNDAVFGTLFWFIVAGGPGALLFRLANTLDAMWGYRTDRYLAYGWAAARIDDALNWLPARLTAASYALLGDTRLAWHCWRSQAPDWSSPNAGPVMAAGAGALGLSLGGMAVYHGVPEMRPPLGMGRLAAGEDIGRAWRLVATSTVLWLAIVTGLAVLA